MVKMDTPELRKATQITKNYSNAFLNTLIHSYFLKDATVLMGQRQRGKLFCSFSFKRFRSLDHLLKNRCRVDRRHISGILSSEGHKRKNEDFELICKSNSKASADTLIMEWYERIYEWDKSLTAAFLADWRWLIDDLDRQYHRAL